MFDDGFVVIVVYYHVLRLAHVHDDIDCIRDVYMQNRTSLWKQIY